MVFPHFCHYLHISDGPIECCPSNGEAFREPSTEELEAICFPIELPEGTVNDKRCQNFVRSVGSPRLDCNPSPVEQLNQITHWLDASNVYGSSQNQSLSLRKLEDGLLKSDFDSNGQEFLPFNTLGSFVGPVHCRGQSGT